MKNKMLMKYLENISHPDPSVRHDAAEKLADGNERAIYPLIKALRDENPGVQDAAMRSLIAIGGEVTAYMLLPLLREDAYLRNTAILILQQLGESTIKVIRPLLKDKDDDVRKFALDIISHIGHCDYPNDIINMLRSDPNPNVRASAARAIEALRLFNAVDELISALNDEEWVAVSALQALSSLKCEKAVTSIVRLISSPHISVRVAVIEAISNLESREGFKLLMEYFPKMGEIEKYEIIKAILKNEFYEIIGKIEGIENILLDILKQSDWEEKILAIKGLINIGMLQHLPEIIDIAGVLDPAEPYDEEILYSVKDILRQSGCNEFFIKVINDDAFKYRAKVLAIELIGELQCEKAIDSLIKILEKDVRDIRRASISALSNVAHREEVQKVLLTKISDPDSHVRKVAISTLGKIGKKEAFEPIWNVLINEKYIDIITEALYALENIDRNTLLERLRELPENIKKIAIQLGLLEI